MNTLENTNLDAIGYEVKSNTPCSGSKSLTLEKTRVVNLLPANDVPGPARITGFLSILGTNCHNKSAKSKCCPTSQNAGCLSETMDECKGPFDNA